MTELILPNFKGEMAAAENGMGWDGGGAGGGETRPAIHELTPARPPRNHHHHPPSPFHASRAKFLACMWHEGAGPESLGRAKLGHATHGDDYLEGFGCGGVRREVGGGGSDRSKMHG